MLAHGRVPEQRRVALAGVVPERTQELERDQLGRERAQPLELGVEVGRDRLREQEVGRPEEPREPEVLEAPAQARRQTPSPPHPRVLGGVPLRLGEHVQAQRRLVRGGVHEADALDARPSPAGSGCRGARRARARGACGGMRCLPCFEDATKRPGIATEAISPGLQTERPARGADEMRARPSVHARAAQMKAEPLRAVAHDDAHRARAHPRPGAASRDRTRRGSARTSGVGEGGGAVVVVPPPAEEVVKRPFITCQCGSQA